MLALHPLIYLKFVFTCCKTIHVTFSFVVRRCVILEIKDQLNLDAKTTYLRKKVLLHYFSNHGRNINAIRNILCVVCFSQFSCESCFSF